MKSRFWYMVLCVVIWLDDLNEAIAGIADSEFS